MNITSTAHPLSKPGTARPSPPTLERPAARPPLDTRGGHLTTWLRFAVIAIALAGLAYPLAAAWLGEALFPLQARGSLIERDGVVVGSRLVAQAFSGDGYFHPRPSAAGYDPRALAGSNLAPGNPALREPIATTSALIATLEQVEATRIPVELVSASGSGIDPHISPAGAQLQAARIARVRGIDPDRLRTLIREHTLPPTWGVLGQARVNVLELNLALDTSSR